MIRLAVVHSTKRATVVAASTRIRQWGSTGLADQSDRPLSRVPSRCFGSQPQTSTFVSKYNTSIVSDTEIQAVCENNGIDASQSRKTNGHVVLKECPFCSKPTKGKADNFYKMYIKIGGGAYFCHRCGASGSWYDFKRKLGGFEISGTDQMVGSPTGRSVGNVGRNGGTDSVSCLPMPPERLNACYVTNLLDQQPQNEVLDYLINTRGLTKATLRKYGVGSATYKFPSSEGNRYEPAECVTFPWIMRASEVEEQEKLRGASYGFKDANSFVTRRVKARALKQKAWQRLDPAGGGWGLFGFHTIPPEATEVVITEGEYDAMAVFQATGRPAVSLPNGCRSLPVEVLPMLERFEKIYLWMDADQPGQEGAEKFANKIGIQRCLIVKPEAAGTPKDANEALLAGMDLNEFLEKAETLRHEFVLGFKDLRAQVLNELMYPHQFTGVQATSLPGFSSIIKGFRRGEVTVLTGPTGSGKVRIWEQVSPAARNVVVLTLELQTTFLGQLSLDFAEQGINTLWGSFEIKNTRLMHKLLQQYNRDTLPAGDPSCSEELEALADRFEDLPLYFLKFHGGSDVDDVLNAMDYATYVHDVEHIILDNMQFMISRNGTNKSFDKFDIQDMAVEKFRRFATEKNVHLSLVVHPRKEDENVKLGISSIYGSAKATQEADTVLILQHDGKRKYIDVKKNRFDGELGYMPLFFERKSGRYIEKPSQSHATHG